MPQTDARPGRQAFWFTVAAFRVERSVGRGRFRPSVLRLVIGFIHGGAFFAVADAPSGQRTRGSRSHGDSPHHRGAGVGGATSQVFSRRSRSRVRGLDVRGDARRGVSGCDRVSRLAHRAGSCAPVVRGCDYSVRWDLHHHQLAEICRHKCGCRRRAPHGRCCVHENPQLARRARLLDRAKTKRCPDSIKGAASHVGSGGGESAGCS